MSENGVAVYNRKSLSTFIIPVDKQDVIDVTGAGDTFISTLCLGIVNGKDIINSSRLANMFSGDVIKHIGTVPPNILNILKTHNKIIQSLDKINMLMSSLNSRKNYIIFSILASKILNENDSKLSIINKILLDLYKRKLLYYT